MHPETKKINTKNMPYLTLTENLKLQLSPGLVASYDIQPGNRVGLFWDKQMIELMTLSVYKSIKFNDRKIVLLQETVGFIKSLIHALKKRKKILTTAAAIN